MAAGVRSTGAPVQPPPAACHTADTTRDLHRLTTWALDAGVALEGLTVTKPSLEDESLQLVGDESGEP